MIPQIQCRPIPNLFIYPRNSVEAESAALLNEETGLSLQNEETGEDLLSE